MVRTAAFGRHAWSNARKCEPEGAPPAGLSCLTAAADALADAPEPGKNTAHEGGNAYDHDGCDDARDAAVADAADVDVCLNGSLGGEVPDRDAAVEVDQLPAGFPVAACAYARVVAWQPSVCESSGLHGALRRDVQRNLAIGSNVRRQLLGALEAAPVPDLVGLNGDRSTLGVRTLDVVYARRDALRQIPCQAHVWQGAQEDATRRQKGSGVPGHAWWSAWAG